LPESPPIRRLITVNESLRVRKEKMLARKRLRRDFAEGKIRLEQFCLAAQAKVGERRPPLILPKLSEAEYSWSDDDFK
jgi:hypothetical protein